MKILLIVLDGLADHAVVELGGQTPLQTARTPNFDELAKQLQAYFSQLSPFGRPRVSWPTSSYLATVRLIFLGELT